MIRRARAGRVMLHALATVLVVLTLISIPRTGDRPAPDRANVAYGDHFRHRLDVWLVPGEVEQPTPVLVYFHGGGFRGGDKRDIPARILRRCLRQGIAVVSANYRLSQHAPYPAPMNDGARVVQFVRENARAWGLDPDRIALSGNSAGGGIALWVAFHDDLAEPESDDPVSRQSTRVSYAAVVGAQTSYDPAEIEEWIGGRAHQHPALRPLFGLKPKQKVDENVQSLFREASPIHHLTADDPPVWMYYFEPDGPMPEDARPGQGIHHPKFGWILRDRMEKLGIECTVHHCSENRSGDPTLDPDHLLVDSLRGPLEAEAPTMVAR